MTESDRVPRELVWRCCEGLLLGLVGCFAVFRILSYST